MSQEQIEAFLAAHPHLAAVCTVATPLGVVLLIVMARLARIELSPEQMRERPRLASLVMVARYIGPWVAPALKFIGGIVSSSLAKAAIEAFLNGQLGPVSSNPPPPQGDSK